MNHSAFSRLNSHTLMDVIAAIDLVVTEAHGEDQTADLHADYAAIAMLEFLRCAFEETPLNKKKKIYKQLIKSLQTMSEVQCSAPT
jgi:hypothetical protein